MADSASPAASRLPGAGILLAAQIRYQRNSAQSVKKITSRSAGDVGPDFRQELGHRAAELGDQEEADRAGLVQHVGELGGPQGRVRSWAGSAQPRSVLQTGLRREPGREPG